MGIRKLMLKRKAKTARRHGKPSKHSSPLHTLASRGGTRR